MMMRRDPNHPFAQRVILEELRFAKSIATALKLESACGYNMESDESWLRISHNDLHLLLKADGREPALEASL